MYEFSPRAQFWGGLVLWIIAVVLGLSAMLYQRVTGPTYPLRGQAEFEQQTVDYRLPRTATTGQDTQVSLPDVGYRYEGKLYFKRYKTEDPLTEVALRLEGDKLVAELPSQPPAGKLEYYMLFTGPLSLQDWRPAEVRVPAEENVVIRYKGAVPAVILAPHVILMILVVIFGIRTLLAALTNRQEMRILAWITFWLMAVGGMILGPAVQQYAFGAAWTGIPVGWDLTDNKMLIMFLCWLVAIAVLGRGRSRIRPAQRWVTVLVALVMIVVYLIPHSMYGSELDYSQVDQGVPPEQAIGQG